MNAKIIATIGPKSEDYNSLKSMALSGMDLIRMNFSHANYDQYYKIKENINKINEELNIKIRILFDLQGPRIRVGKLKHEIEIVEGEIYTIMYDKGNVDNLEIPIDDLGLINDLKIGDPIYLDSGMIELKVMEINLLENKFIARAERGGLLMSRKGVNVPKTILNRDILTAKDLLDIEFAKKVKPDFVAASFVQTPEDVIKVKQAIGNEDIKIISKIERGVALDNIDGIIRNSDCIMIARGDLGIEIPMEDLPIVQKNLIRHAHWHDKPAIVATQMMASMIDHYRPTRAEVSDVANAIFDGADALMLSDETAMGNYPVETVHNMNKIIKRTDQYFSHRNYFDNLEIIYKK
ncbi:MAG TPA: pyruvate kinase [bacterium]|nr:pyruvate kinase [bacterium]